MINIEFVDLTKKEFTFPSERVGMVLAQPYLPARSLTEKEPFQLTDEHKRQQLQILDEVLSVACLSRDSGLKTHFTIVPEYCMPGFEGVQLVENKLSSSNWPTGTILIAGTDGLTVDQYREIGEGNSTHVADCNLPRQVSSSKWVNCAVVWIKFADGRLDRWIQPKLSAAWEEENVCHEKMFRGRSIYVFKGKFENGGYFLFCTLICFDWIARIGNLDTFEWLLHGIHNEAGSGQLPVTWIFVIQRNANPSHQTFLDRIQQFFNHNGYPNARKDNTCLVFANTAGKAGPGPSSEFGSTSMVFSPRVPFVDPNCYPTFSMGGPKFRDSNETLRVYHCKDVFFRERGAGIHSIVQNIPESVGSGPSNRTIALEDAKVYPISGVSEARAPKDPVPAATKWLHDELDGMCRVHPPCSPFIDNEIEKAHFRVVKGLRKLSSKETMRKMKLASDEVGECPDEWDSMASKGLRHVVRTLGVVGTACPLRGTCAKSFHATAVLNDQQVDVVAIRGDSHQACEEHLKAHDVRNPSRHLLLISRDSQNTLRNKRDGSILEWNSSSLDKDPKITETRGFVIGYQNLWSIVQGADRVDDIAAGINEKLSN